MADEFVVTIDGPAGSGKTTTAREIARRLNFVLLESGAFYRFVTWALLKKGVLPGKFPHSEGLSSLISSLLKEVRVKLSPEGTVLILNDQPLKEELRSKEVENWVSFVSAHPVVRETITSFLRDLVKGREVVTEGRDMGTVVFPQANLKVFLTADIEVRAKRRANDVGDRNLEEIKRNLLERDKLDSERELAPLKKPEGALEIDTTNLSIKEVVERIISEIERRKVSRMKT